MAIAKYSLLALIAAVATGFAAVYALSERALRDVTPPPPFTFSEVADSAITERGRHIARTRGCLGCHGEQLQGTVFEEPYPWPARAVAPNLPAFARDHAPAVLDAAIRYGIGHDGRALWAMPSYNFRHLSDADLAALIAYFRSEQPLHAELPSARLGWRVRWAIATGAEQHMVELVSEVPDLRLGGGDDPKMIQGEYLAMTTCNECHGLDLRGFAEGPFGTPDLAIVSAYSLDDFTRMLREGVAIGGRDDLPLMSVVARDRFAYFTDEEIGNLYTFLRTLAAEPTPQDVSWRE